MDDLNLSTCPSPTLKLGLQLLFSLALLACWICALSWLYKVMLSLILLATWPRTVRLVCEPVNLRYTRARGWQMQSSGGGYQVVSILPSTVVFPGLIVLHYCGSDQIMQSNLIARDTVTPDVYRHLVVALKTAH